MKKFALVLVVCVLLPLPQAVIGQQVRFPRIANDWCYPRVDDNGWTGVDICEVQIFDWGAEFGETYIGGQSPAWSPDGLALAIASAGLYGVTAYLVTQRTREIGVRLALGAAPARVMAAVIGRGIAHTAAGVAIGIALSWQLASLVEAFLFEVRPHDPIVYGGAAALLAACGVAAAFIPARRAARVDPVIALRAE